MTATWKSSTSKERCWRVGEPTSTSSPGARAIGSRSGRQVRRVSLGGEDAVGGASGASRCRGIARPLLAMPGERPSRLLHTQGRASSRSRRPALLQSERPHLGRHAARPTRLREASVRGCADGSVATGNLPDYKLMLTTIHGPITILANDLKKIEFCADQQPRNDDEHRPRDSSSRRRERQRSRGRARRRRGSSFSSRRRCRPLRQRHDSQACQGHRRAHSAKRARRVPQPAENSTW